MDIPKKTKGFTLIEMLVAIGIFSVLMSSLTGIFLSSMQSQSHILYTQYLIDDANFVLDYMGKYVRMAQEDATGTCVGVPGNNFNPASGSAQSISFIDYKGQCHSFALDINSGRITEQIDSGAAAFITTDKIKITNVRFSVLGGDGGDDIQPRITIVIQSEANTTRLDPPPRINAQTSISQRNLDF